MFYSNIIKKVKALRSKNFGPEDYLRYLLEM